MRLKLTIKRDDLSFLFSSSGLALAAIVGVHLAISIPESITELSPFWFPAGIYIFMLLVWEKKAVPAIIASTLIINLLTMGRPFNFALLSTVSIIVEAYIGYFFLRPFRATDELFEGYGDSARILVASVIAPVLNAVLGSLHESLRNQLTPQETLVSFATWWLAHSIGILLVLPFLLSWWKNPKINKKEWINFTLYVVFSLPFLVGIFFIDGGEKLLFGAFLLILPVALYMRRHFLFTFVILVNLTALFGTTLGAGPFQGSASKINLIHMQIFLATVSMSAMLLTGFYRTSPFQAPVLTLAFGWILSGVIYFLFTDYEENKERNRARDIASALQEEIDDELKDKVSFLRAGIGFIANRAHVDQLSWALFVDDLEALSLSSDQLPILGLGVMEADVVSDSKKVVITLLAPDSPENRNALGLDIWSNIEMREQALFAARLATPTLLGPIDLDKVIERNYLVMPFYTTPQAKLIEENRLSQLSGFVFAPFLIQNFFAEMFDRRTLPMSLDVYEDGKVVFKSKTRPMHLDESTSFVTKMSFANRSLKMVWARSNKFISTRGASAVILSSATALLILSLAAMALNLRLLGQRAELTVEEKTRELALRNKEIADQASMLSQIMDSVPIGIFRGSKDGILLLVNDEWQRIVGGTNPSISRTFWGRLRGFAADDESGLRFLQRVMRQGRLQRQDFVLEGINGSEMVVCVTLVPEVNSDGDVVGFLGTLQDETDIKHAHEELERQRAITAHSAKMASLGEMASGIAHEINNPLAIIHGRSHMIQQMIRRGTSSEDQLLQGLQVIEHTAMRISKIIRGLRTFSRSGEKDKFQAEDLHILIEQTLDFCRERFRINNVELFEELVPHVLIDCRATQISQVILNLLNNSLDVVAKLPERWVRISVEHSESRVRIAITDSGPGIPPELRLKIFQPFFTTKQTSGGTGLGLSISLGIIEEHHGLLYVDESAANTRFVIELPKRQTIFMSEKVS